MWEMECHGHPQSFVPGKGHVNTAEGSAVSLPAPSCSDSFSTLLSAITHLKARSLGLGGAGLCSRWIRDAKNCSYGDFQSKAPNKHPIVWHKICWEGRNKLGNLHTDEFNTDFGFRSIRILEGFRKPEDLEGA